MKNRKVLSYAGGGGSALSGTSSVTDSRPAKYRTGSAGGFTMAEILLSLTIIGVVAAITLPSLTGNINERTWNTQRKALYARMSQAMALMPNLNGYGTLTAGDDSTSAVDTAAETFITDGLSKVLKINNICDSEDNHLQDCGLPEKITPLDGGSTVNLSDITTLVDYNYMFNGENSATVDGVTHTYSYSQLNTKAAAFETQNGESILVYYNPYCISSDMPFTYSQPKVCANFVYDLNGNKGPNTVGKDIGFITILHSSDPTIVAPVLANMSTKVGEYEELIKYCRSFDDARLPNRDELISLFTNKKLVGSVTTANVVSSTPKDVDMVYHVHFRSGIASSAVYKSAGNTALCVKRN